AEGGGGEIVWGCSCQGDAAIRRRRSRNGEREAHDYSTNCASYVYSSTAKCSGQVCRADRTGASHGNAAAGFSVYLCEDTMLTGLNGKHRARESRSR
ncbi:hypothetical protein OAN61_00910, partial [bacterium]|nr:hypothetical protein [bacterium]